MRPVELAARRYIDAWKERDRDRRAVLLEACFALDGRLVAPGRTIRGRAALDGEIAAFLANPRFAGVRASSVIDVARDVFRFRTVLEFSDGRPPSEALDVGEVDGEGRIAVLYTFSEPLAAAD